MHQMGLKASHIRRLTIDSQLRSETCNDPSTKTFTHEDDVVGVSTTSC